MEQMKQLSERMSNADAVLIGAANGLSITEGIHLFANDETLHALFGDLQSRYGLQSLLHGMTARWPSVEELWGFWSRMANHCSGTSEASPVMRDLMAIVGDKDFFIVTSNGEEHFELAGFDPQRIYEVEGQWLHLTCSAHCSDGIVPGMGQIRTMAAAEKGGVVPIDLIPRCAGRGAPMIPTMAAGVADSEAKERLQQFLKAHHGENLVILELGMGARNQLIKAPLMRLAAREPNATYVTFNLNEPYVAPDIRDKCFAVEGYLDDTLGELRQACAR